MISKQKIKVIFLMALGLTLGWNTAWAAGKVHVMDQKGLKFVPSQLTIKQGDTVVFKNSDKELHNVKSLGPTRFNIGVKPGKSISKVFKRPGKHPIRCNVHSKMKATIIVR